MAERTVDGTATVIDAPTEVGATAHVRVEGYRFVDFTDDEGFFEGSVELSAEVCPPVSQMPY